MELSSEALYRNSFLKAKHVIVPECPFSVFLHSAVLKSYRLIVLSVAPVANNDFEWFTFMQ